MGVMIFTSDFQVGRKRFHESPIGEGVRGDPPPDDTQRAVRGAGGDILPG